MRLIFLFLALAVLVSAADAGQTLTPWIQINLSQKLPANENITFNGGYLANVSLPSEGDIYIKHVGTSTVAIWKNGTVLASCTAGSDDDVPVMAALAKGGKIIWEAGTFYVGSNWEPISGTSIVGAGSALTIIKPAAGFGGHMIRSAYQSDLSFEGFTMDCLDQQANGFQVYGYYGNDASNILFSDVVVRDSIAFGILLGDLENVTIDNVYTRGCGTSYYHHGVYLRNCTRNYISHSRFDDNYSLGIKVASCNNTTIIGCSAAYNGGDVGGGGFGLLDESRDASVISCTSFHNIYGYVTQETPQWTIHPPRDIVFRDDTSYGDRIGFYINQGTNVRISGCLVNQSTQWGIMAEAPDVSHISILDTNVEHCGSTKYHSIYIGDVCNYSISRCHVVGDADNQYGIYLSNTAHGIISDNEIHHFLAASGCGIYCIGTHTSVRIHDNDVHDNTFRNIRLSTGVHAIDNLGFNPVGYFTGTGHAHANPAVPASTVALTNAYGYPCMVSIYGGTVTEVAVGGHATGQTSPATVTVGPGQTIAITYSSAPSWAWYGL